jgi:hypothetical protein
MTFGRWFILRVLRDLRGFKKELDSRFRGNDRNNVQCTPYRVHVCVNGLLPRGIRVNPVLIRVYLEVHGWVLMRGKGKRGQALDFGVRTSHRHSS